MSMKRILMQAMAVKPPPLNIDYVNMESLNEQFKYIKDTINDVKVVDKLISNMESFNSIIANEDTSKDDLNIINTAMVTLLKPYGFKNVGLEYVSTNIKDLWTIKRKLIEDEMQNINEWNISNNATLTEFIDYAESILVSISDRTGVPDKDYVSVDTTSNVLVNILDTEVCTYTLDKMVVGVSKYIDLISKADLSNERELEKLVITLTKEAREINKDILTGSKQVDLSTITEYVQMHDVSDDNETIKCYINDEITANNSFTVGFWIDESNFSLLNLAFAKENTTEITELPPLQIVDIVDRLNSVKRKASDLLSGSGSFVKFKNIYELSIATGNVISTAASNSSSISAKSRDILGVLLNDVVDGQIMIKEFVLEYMHYLTNQLAGNINYAIASIDNIIESN